MPDIVIKAENLGKKYTIGHQAADGRYLALRDVVMQNARSLWRVTKDLVRGKPIILGDNLEEVWALKDVSFEIRRGEAVGIIGRNGAGKSTLLKVLSRITEPSVGRVTIKGRVASLLEVGTGFHPELTGRENIYLNGAILGMTRAEIKRKFDEIVAFAEIEKFLDTPVKRFSSGMYVRLAFAVAAHLEPEILLVDEVLAVGDGAFQKKCLGKMGDVAQEGRTVLFVSHNMAAIEYLCARTVLLNTGSIVSDSPTKDSIARYMATSFDRGKQDLSDYSARQGSGEIRITSFALRDGNDNPVAIAQCGEALRIALGFVRLRNEHNLRIYVSVSCRTLMGAPVFLLHNRMAEVEFDCIPSKGAFICDIGSLNLTPSTYLLSATILVGTDFVDILEDAFQLVVEGGNYLGGGEVPPPSFGPCVMKATWSLSGDDLGVTGD
ncbi:MAG: ABC transporter ATP-binding protein [Anaerolineae bacterium]|jgi:lipopolysaccharide transport system ATP-binding protein|nr:ABC transporter ATP-binding protein [Anaerolineae bacterium]